MLLIVICVYYRIESPDMSDLCQYTDQGLAIYSRVINEIDKGYLHAVTNGNYSHQRNNPIIRQAVAG